MSTYRTYTSLSFASLLGDAKSFWFWAHALKPSYLGSHAKLKSNDCSVIYICHIPRSSAFFFLNIMLEYIILTPSYANSSYAMFSGQSWGRISGYCCMHKFKKKCLTYCNLSKISWHFILEVTSHVTELRRNWVRCPPYCKNW